MTMTTMTMIAIMRMERPEPKGVSLAQCRVRIPSLPDDAESVATVVDGVDVVVVGPWVINKQFA